MRRDLFAVTESLIEVSVAIATPPIRTAAKAIEYCTSFISTWSAPLLFFLPVSLNSRSQPLIRFCKSLRMVLAGTRTRLACPDSVFSFRNKCLHSDTKKIVSCLGQGGLPAWATHYTSTPGKPTCTPYTTAGERRPKVAWKRNEHFREGSLGTCTREADLVGLPAVGLWPPSPSSF